MYSFCSAANIVLNDSSADDGHNDCYACTQQSLFMNHLICKPLIRCQNASTVSYGAGHLDTLFMAPNWLASFKHRGDPQWPTHSSPHQHWLIASLGWPFSGATIKPLAVDTSTFEGASLEVVCLNDKRRPSSLGNCHYLLHSDVTTVAQCAALS